MISLISIHNIISLYSYKASKQASKQINKIFQFIYIPILINRAIFILHNFICNTNSHQINSHFNFRFSKKIMQLNANGA